MAKIDEEQILVRFSLLIRDGESEANTTITTESFRSNIEVFAQELADATGLPVIAEANFVSNIQI